jgi:haloacetate dehalogenase
MIDAFAGFAHHRVDVGEGIIINARSGGTGPPLLLLHGDPQNHFCWRKVAPLLATRYHVVAADLRGYGESSKPVGDTKHIAYSKRVVAQDQVSLMRQLGHPRFAVVGHDRGGRVAHRMLLDHADTVTAGVVVDIIPTNEMFSTLADHRAASYFWWYLNIQPAPMPETMIAADIDNYFYAHLGLAGGRSVFEPDVLARYLASYRRPDHIHGVCEDYRAAFTIDRDQHDLDTAEGRLITQPLAILWGRDGLLGSTDPSLIWQRYAANTVGVALPGGHYLPEESPNELTQAVVEFLTGTTAHHRTRTQGR